MVGRRENPLPAEGELRFLAGRLREVRDGAGITYREMEMQANYTASALSQAASGQKYPTWPCVLGYLKACGLTEETKVKEVLQLWESAEAERLAAKRRTPDDELAAEMEPAAIAELLSMPELSPAPDPQADPRHFKDFHEFLSGLHFLKKNAGLGVKRLIEITEKNAETKNTVWLGETVPLKKTTLYDVLAGKVRPSEDFTIAYVSACGLGYDEIHAWGRCYRQLQDQELRAAAALKALTGTTPALSATDLAAEDESWPTEDLEELECPTEDPPQPAPRRIGIDVATGNPAATAINEHGTVPRHRRMAIRIMRPTFVLEISEETLTFGAVIVIVLIIFMTVFFAAR